VAMGKYPGLFGFMKSQVMSLNQPAGTPHTGPGSFPSGQPWRTAGTPPPGPKLGEISNLGAGEPAALCTPLRGRGTLKRMGPDLILGPIDLFVTVNGMAWCVLGLERGQQLVLARRGLGRAFCHDLVNSQALSGCSSVAATAASNPLTGLLLYRLRSPIPSLPYQPLCEALSLGPFDRGWRRILAGLRRQVVAQTPAKKASRERTPGLPALSCTRTWYMWSCGDVVM
jgi:hypothetical protein